MIVHLVFMHTIAIALSDLSRKSRSILKLQASVAKAGSKDQRRQTSGATWFRIS